MCKTCPSSFFRVRYKTNPAYRKPRDISAASRCLLERRPYGSLDREPWFETRGGILSTTPLGVNPNPTFSRFADPRFSIQPTL